MKSDILVSIICCTYNHEQYIEDALKGFVMQQTSFNFEVLIHDDASTDGTVAIVEKYVQKYPELIKPIYQKENQYSKGVDIYRDYLYSKVLGKYIAICEGDDYWTDPLKLQKQVDILETHSEIDICVHKAVALENGIHKYYVPEMNKEQIFSPTEVISMGGGGVATASIMYRSRLEKNVPKFRKTMNFDYTLQVHGALRGGMYYIPDVMSVYRLSTEASWTRIMQRNTTAKETWLKKVINMLEILDEETKQEYNNEIQKRLNYNKCELFYIQNKYKEFYKSPCNEIYYSYPITKRIKMQMKMRFPKLYIKLLWLKNGNK